MSSAAASVTGSIRQTRSGVFKRSYKACEACRKSKSKCELQPTLSDSVCSRCRREQRQCVFPSQRSTKRTKADKLASSRKSDGTNVTTASTDQTRPQNDGSNMVVDEQSNDGVSAMEYDVHARHDATQSDQAPRLAQRGDLSETLAKTMVTSSKDAMGLLFQAAGQHDTDSRSDDEDSMDDTPGPREELSETTSPLMYSEAHLPSQLSEETLALWNKHRFVVQGWFSAVEAISYLQFFLERFAPLSPVADFFYADHNMHKRLILDEPLLCCTILMISSRAMPAHGRAGKTRSSFIHGRLWRHIEHLVLRITFGSEKYSSAKSRTLGSIQALLLIIEWHPRLLHFPPEHDGWDAGLAHTVDDTFQYRDRTSEKSRRWREDVFEPAKRSDRLSWTLVGLAITLGHELGVFDPDIAATETGSADSSDPTTKIRIRRLLFLYSQQLALRLGCPNMFPQGDHSVTHPPVATTPAQIELTSRDRDALLTKWIEVTKLLATATQMFFSNKAATKSMLRSSQYISLLEHFQPLLSRWHEDYSKTTLPTVPAAAKHALLVEYYYTRMYINSIALQGFVERASQASAGEAWLEQDFLRKERAQDLGFINDVRESSGQILVITKKLSDDGILLYMPVRFFLRVVAASIFLLKVICLGSKGNETTVALGQLEGAVQALMANDSDDIHLARSYAELISRHVRKLKRKLLSERASRSAARGNAPPLPTSASDLNPAHTQSGGSDVLSGLGLGTESAPAMDMDDTLFSADSWSDAFWDDWLVRPLDPLVAPFGIEPTSSVAAGFASDSLDFLWNHNM